MAKINWTEPAFYDLDEITGYIAIEDPDAADRVNRRILDRVKQLEKHPESGSFPQELPGTEIRQLVETPCRIFYRFDGKKVWILHILRFERLLRYDRIELDDD